MDSFFEKASRKALFIMIIMSYEKIHTQMIWGKIIFFKSFYPKSFYPQSFYPSIILLPIILLPIILSDTPDDHGFWIAAEGCSKLFPGFTVGESIDSCLTEY